MFIFWRCACLCFGVVMRLLKHIQSKWLSVLVLYFIVCCSFPTILALFVLLAMAIYTGVTVNFLGKRFGDWRFSWSYILGWVALLMTFFAGWFMDRDYNRSLHLLHLAQSQQNQCTQNTWTFITFWKFYLQKYLEAAVMSQCVLNSYSCENLYNFKCTSIRFIQKNKPYIVLSKTHILCIVVCCHASAQLTAVVVLQEYSTCVPTECTSAEEWRAHVEVNVK